MMGLIVEDDSLYKCNGHSTNILVSEKHFCVGERGRDGAERCIRYEGKGRSS
jgi:hypothetical protein